MFVASTVGIVLPAARYTSYDAAPAEAGHVSLADVCEGSTDAFAGNVLVTQAASTGAAAVVNVVDCLVHCSVRTACISGEIIHLWLYKVEVG